MKSVIGLVLGIFLFVTLGGTANGVEVPKETWVDAMSTALPAYFCKPDQYFRQCFTVTQVVCEDTAMSTTRICLKKYNDDFPDIFTQPKDGSEWGGKVGACAGEAYEITLKENRIDSKKCNDVENWR
jgi:hypothetical protein